MEEITNLTEFIQEITSGIAIQGLMIGTAIGSILLWKKPKKSTRRPSDLRISGDLVGRINHTGDMSTFNLGGRTFRGNNINITNNRITIDGKDVTDEYDTKPTGILEIRITEGIIGNLTTDANVNAGNITGNVDAGGNISCDNVGGNVTAGGNVSCGNVSGSVKAGGNIRHG